jgi:hypothetical protein
MQNALKRTAGAAISALPLRKTLYRLYRCYFAFFCFC